MCFVHGPSGEWFIINDCNPCKGHQSSKETNEAWFGWKACQIAMLNEICFKCKQWWNSAIVYYHLNEINQFVYIWVIIATIMHSHNHKYLFFDSSLVPWYLKFQRRFIGAGFRLCRITLRFVSHPFWKLSVGQFQTEIYLAHSQVKRHKKSVFLNLSFWSFFFPNTIFLSKFPILSPPICTPFSFTTEF